ncbi:MAG TPA: hypothetical protein VGK93_00060 [Candidatus Eisenbacteria bacterium]
MAGPPAAPGAQTGRVRRLRRAILLAAAGLVILSCSKRMTGVNDLPDPGRYPEGLRGNTDLVVFLDTPTILRVYLDNKDNPDSAGKFSTDDVFVRSETFHATGPGAVQGVILDSTNANRFEVYRGVGTDTVHFQQLRDFAFRPVKLFVQSHWEAYAFADPKPVASTDREYVGRGVVAGITNATSPLTNVGEVPVNVVPGNLVFTAKTGNEIPCLNCATQIDPRECRRQNQCPDSLLYLEWEAAPGARGYWVQVYQLAASLSGDDIIRSGIASPLFLGPTRDFFVAYIPETTASRPSGQPDRRSYRIGDPLPEGSHQLFHNIVFNDRLYTVRISAVGPAGELLNYTGESGSFQAFSEQREGKIFFRVFPVGGVVVQPKQSAAPPVLTTAGASGTTRLERRWILPAGMSRLGRRR